MMKIYKKFVRKYADVVDLMSLTITTLVFAVIYFPLAMLAAVAAQVRKAWEEAVVLHEWIRDN